MTPAPSPPSPPTIHEATCASHLTGLVEWGAALSEPAAIARRQLSLDIVVRGSDRAANRKVAEKIEAGVGLYKVCPFHQSAGTASLPHCQQINKPPFGHSFYETATRKAKKKP